MRFAQGSGNSVPRFPAERYDGPIVGRQRLLPHHPAQEPDLFEIARAPGANQQVQSEFQEFRQRKSALQRFRHERRHFLTGLKRSQQRTFSRFLDIAIESQIVFSFDDEN